MKKRGIIFYPEHIKVVRGLLPLEEIGSLFLAVCDYAASGAFPEEQPSQAWSVCFDLMRGAVDENEERYAAACERDRANASKRWKATGCGRNQSDTTACDGMRSNAVDANIIEHSITEESITKQKQAPPAAAPDPPSVLEAVAQIPNVQHAEQLMCRYGMPDSDVTLEALLEDIEKHGEETVEAALKTARSAIRGPGCPSRITAPC